MTLDFLAAIRSESARFGDALRSCAPTAQVPSCPDWTAQDLLAHLVKVQSFWVTIVRDRLQAPAEAAEEDAPADYGALLDAFDRTAADLYRALAETADDVAVWTWADVRSVGFVRRRQAHEALIHRLDAELTAQDVTDVETALAADGVDEVLRVMFGAQPAWMTWTPGSAIGAIELSDADGSWRFRLGTLAGVHPATGRSYVDKPRIELFDDEDESTPLFTISGSARDVDAWLWNRPPRADLELGGDEAAYAKFRGMVQHGIR